MYQTLRPTGTLIRAATEAEMTSDTPPADPTLAAYPFYGFEILRTIAPEIDGPLGLGQQVTEAEAVGYGQTALLMRAGQPPRWVTRDREGELWYSPLWSKLP